MSRERINTARESEVIPEGTRKFIISGPLKKMYVGKDKTMEMFIVPVQFDEGLGEQAFLAGMMGNFLRAMGCKEVSKNVFDFDTEEFEGKTFMATVTHYPDKKDPSKMRSNMSEFSTPKEDEIPF